MNQERGRASQHCNLRTRIRFVNFWPDNEEELKKKKICASGLAERERENRLPSNAKSNTRFPFDLMAKSRSPWTRWLQHIFSSSRYLLHDSAVVSPSIITCSVLLGSRQSSSSRHGTFFFFITNVCVSLSLYSSFTYFWYSSLKFVCPLKIILYFGFLKLQYKEDDKFNDRPS